MTVTEIFASIQGESTLQGLPCVFIRLTGCNLNCRYCDTRYAREGGSAMTADEIIQAVSGYTIPFICITGGEPLLQKDTPFLARSLIDCGYTVSVETNGTIDASPLPEEAKRIIDIKCPGSGEQGKTSPNNLSLRRPTDEFKFVLTDRRDFLYARDFLEKNNLTPESTVLFSPAWRILDPALLCEWIINELPGVRLNLQLHKYIWPETDRGR